MGNYGILGQSPYAQPTDAERMWQNGLGIGNAVTGNGDGSMNPNQGNVSPYRHTLEQNNSPQEEATELANRENRLLGRQATQIGGLNGVDSSGLDASRFNQMRAINSQKELMAGPSLANLKANQNFGAAQQAMMGARDPRAMRAAMLGGGAQLGALSQKTGNAVGDEWMKGQQNIAGAYNTLGQNDISTQQGLEQLEERQRQLNLQQRGQNLGTAQGYEQNYFNEQNAYTQQAQAQWAAYLARKQGLDKSTTDWVGAGTKAAGATMGAAI